MRKYSQVGLQVGIVSAGILLIGGAAHATETEAAHTWQTGPNTGLVNGNQALLPIQLPINICGNAVGVAGNGTAGCTGAASAKYQAGSLHTDWTAGPNTGIANGNQLAAIVQVPINICGNALGILGDATAWCDGGSSAVIKAPDSPGGGHGYTGGKIANRSPLGGTKHGYGDADKDWDSSQIAPAADHRRPAGKPAATPQPAARVIGLGQTEVLPGDVLAGLISLDMITGLLGSVRAG